ncbi:MAG: hypothetical protein MI923_22380 [Phycisphaerales bacterium]|nr:hypothetical protein [Phycisphaerales bacterium]
MRSSTSRPQHLFGGLTLPDLITQIRIPLLCDEYHPSRLAINIFRDDWSARAATTLPGRQGVTARSHSRQGNLDGSALFERPIPPKARSPPDLSAPNRVVKLMLVA